MNVPTAQWLAANGSVRPTHLGVSKREKKKEKITGRTNAEPTYDADTDATRNPAQKAVPRARNLAHALQVVIRRHSLLAYKRRARQQYAGKGMRFKSSIWIRQ